MTRIGVIVFLSLLLLAPPEGSAKPLSDDACTELAREHAVLVRSGVERQMQNDPARAGSVLGSEDMANIQRFLFIEGQLRFRCPNVDLPPPKPSKASGTQAADVEKNDSKKPSGPAVPLPNRKPVPRSKRAG